MATRERWVLEEEEGVVSLVACCMAGKSRKMPSQPPVGQQNILD